MFALIEQPRLGSATRRWGDAGGRALLLVAFVVQEATAREPMLPLRLFRRRNFSAGNVETFGIYAGLGMLFFFLVLFLQQIGGYTPLQSGLATLPMTLVMFLLSRRFGALADRYGPRLFMGARAAGGGGRAAPVRARGRDVDYLPDVLPAELVFALGLSLTVAPLTAAVLAGSEDEAGIASGVNNAVARVAGLLGTAAVGAVVAAAFSTSLQHAPARVTLGRVGKRRVAEAERLALGRPTHGLPGQAGDRRSSVPPKRPRSTPSTSASPSRRLSSPPGGDRPGLRPSAGGMPRNAPVASWWA